MFQWMQIQGVDGGLGDRNGVLQKLGGMVSE